MLREYCDGDDEFRNQRLKLIPGIPKGSFVARSVVGNRPAILGTKVDTSYYRGHRWFEVVIDLGSSSAATGVLSVVKGYASGLDIELAWLLESKTEEELPERMLGGVGFHRPNMTTEW
jgi:hypothetical protein